MASVRISGFDGSHEVEDVSSVLEALEAAGISTEVSVRLQGVTVDLSAPVSDGDVLVATPPEVKQGA